MAKAGAHLERRRARAESNEQIFEADLAVVVSIE